MDMHELASTWVYYLTTQQKTQSRIDLERDSVQGHLVLKFLCVRQRVAKLI